MTARANLRTRVWLLILLDGAERAGLTPMSKERFHRLVYLANSLAPIYDLPPPDRKILKYKHGPFYPDVQWDLDRLAVQGLVEILKIKHIRSKLPYRRAAFSPHCPLPRAAL